MITTKKVLIWIMAVLMMLTSLPISALALINTNDNSYIVTGTTPNGKIGKTMSLGITLHNASGKSQSKMGVGIDPDIYFDDEGVVEEDRQSYIFPFEVTEKTFVPVYTKSKLDGDNEKETKKLSLSLKVRKDIKEGYYSVRMAIYNEGESIIAYEYINVWIGTSKSGTDEDDDNKGTEFILGEGQSTPAGTYPGVMSYIVNLRNNSHATVYDVKVTMILDADDKVFPFEINDVNYDRMFEKIEVGQVVELPYSMMIRPDTYTNYYQIKLKITYSENSSGGERKDYESSYYVKVNNKDEEDERREFNEHDRTKARVIVDSFETEPKTIIAGEEFELICRIRNASKSIGATNLLLTLESEKVSDSAIFTTESGSSSIALDSLGPDQLHEVRVRLTSKPGAEQRSYGMKIIAKFDSPEYKNAEENLTIDIPVKQIARLNTSSFEIMPSGISVGEETNVMFGVNNTGKVILYNVMVNFEADSIQSMETYVGNIKPGETGNVDCMLSGVAPTEDSGMIKVAISYEDENGEVSTVEKEMQLYVADAVPEWDDQMAGNFDDIPMEDMSFFAQHKTVILACAGAAAVIVVIIIAVAVRKRKKRKQALDEDVDDEIL